MSRLDVVRRGSVRARRDSRKSARLTPLVSPPSRSHPAAPKQLSRPDVSIKPLTLFEVLGGTSDNPAPSKWGGTTLERCIDNAAARLGYSFDAAQWVVNLTINGSYTVIDRVLFRPRTAVYIDGIEHDIRESADPKDLLQDMELRSEKWLVIRLNWKDIQRDPIGAARSVLFAI